MPPLRSLPWRLHIVASPNSAPTYGRLQLRLDASASRRRVCVGCVCVGNRGSPSRLVHEHPCSHVCLCLSTYPDKHQAPSPPRLFFCPFHERDSQRHQLAQVLGGCNLHNAINRPHEPNTQRATKLVCTLWECRMEGVEGVEGSNGARVPEVGGRGVHSLEDPCAPRSGPPTPRCVP